jgi:hypothetical protein
VHKDWPDEGVKSARLDVIDIRGNGELWISGEIESTQRKEVKRNERRQKNQELNTNFFEGGTLCIRE